MAKTGVSRFFGVTSREAMRQVRLALGPEALIISNRRVNGGVEIIAADPSAVEHVRQNTPAAPSPRAAAPTAAPSGGAATTRAETSLDGYMGQQIEQHISSLRTQLSSQMDTLLWGDTLREHVPTFIAYQRLLSLGYSTNLARRLLTQLPRDYDNVEAWQWVQQQLNEHLPVFHSLQDCLGPGSTTALVGPTGVGKTTTLAKLAYQCVRLYGAEQVALISTDNFRVGAHEQLKIYANLLKVPIHVVQNASEFRQALLSYGPEKVVLVDSVGVSQRDEFVHTQANLLSSSGRAVQRLLVVSAASSGETLDEVARAYKTDGGRPLKGCVVTKLDEASVFGGVVDMAIRYQLPVCFITNGQRVPEDLLLPDQDALKQRLLQDNVDRLAVSPLFRPTVADMAALARQKAGEEFDLLQSQQDPQLQQQQLAMVQLAHQWSVGGRQPTVDQAEIRQALKCLQPSLEWQFWAQNTLANQDLAQQAQALLQPLWASVVRELPAEAPEVFFFHDHLQAPRDWHANARLIISSVWSAQGFWRGPFFVQQMSAQQHSHFPAFRRGYAPSDGVDPYVAAAQALPQSTPSRWQYHVFSAYTQSRFLQWLDAGYAVGCVVPAATRCHDTEASTTVGACIKQASFQPLYLSTEVHALLAQLLQCPAIEINYAAQEVLIAARTKQSQRVRLYGVQIYAAHSGEMLEQFYAFSSLHERAHTRAILQALAVYVLQRPCKRQTQYLLSDLVAEQASNGAAFFEPAQLFYGAVGALLAWRLLYDPRFASVQTLLEKLWGATALQPTQLGSSLRRLVYLEQVFRPS